MDDVTFFTAAGQPAFTAETRTGDYIITYPLGAMEPTAIEVSAIHTQTRDDYVRPAANTTLSYEGKTCYFIDDVEFQDIGGGVQTWRRIWANVPATWSEPGGTFAFTFPAYTASIAFGSIFPVTAIAASGSNYVANTNATGISALDDVFLDLNYVRASQNYHITVMETVLAASSGVNVTLSKVLPGDNVFSSVTGTIRKGNMGRSAAETMEVDSFLLHEYALSSPAAWDVDLPQIDRFSPVTTAGVATDFLTAGTLPTSTLYNSMVNAGTLIVARRSDRGIYRGNIAERTTLLITAR